MGTKCKTYEEWLSPPTRYRVYLQNVIIKRDEDVPKTYVTAANATIFNFDIDIIIARPPWLEIYNVEFGPIFGIMHAVKAVNSTRIIIVGG